MEIALVEEFGTKKLTLKAETQAEHYQIISLADVTDAELKRLGNYFSITFSLKD